MLICYGIMSLTCIHVTIPNMVILYNRYNISKLSKTAWK